MLRRPDGPSYTAIVDEFILRRPSVPLDVMAAQLRHLAEVDGRLHVRVLAVDARIAEFAVPKSAFSLFTFDEPRPLTLAALDTVTSDLLHAGETEVGPYQRLWDRLLGAALSDKDSATLLRKAADEMEGTIS
jgi:hypothetical protein